MRYIANFCPRFQEVVSDSKEVGESNEFEQKTEAEDLHASSDDGVSCDDNLSTFSSGSQALYSHFWLVSYLSA